MEATETLVAVELPAVRLTPGDQEERCLASVLRVPLGARHHVVGLEVHDELAGQVVELRAGMREIEVGRRPARSDRGVQPAAVLGPGVVASSRPHHLVDRRQADGIRGARLKKPSPRHPELAGSRLALLAGDLHDRLLLRRRLGWDELLVRHRQDIDRQAVAQRFLHQILETLRHFALPALSFWFAYAIFFTGPPARRRTPGPPTRDRRRQAGSSR